MGSNLQLAIKVIAALFVILTATTVCGRIARMVGQPRVVGEMIAGVLLGPSLIGGIFPAMHHNLFPKDVNSVLYVLSTIGLTFFMFLSGACIDHKYVVAKAVRRAIVLAISGVIPPLVLGAGAAFVFYRQLAVEGSSMVQFALFLGGALAITAFPMLARILQERDMTNSRIGAMTMMAAGVDDAVAWGLLAIIIALASGGGAASALVTILGAAAFAVLMLTVGRRLLKPLARNHARHGSITHGAMAGIVLLVVAAGWFTDFIGIFSVFGGFITGLAMPRARAFSRELQTRLMDMNGILLVPVFFAYTGLNTQFSGIGNVESLVPLAVIVVLAFIGKYVGCGITARRQGMSLRQASAVGGLMNARGLMILVFINIGLDHQLITSEMFSMLVIVAVVTSAAALPIYRLSLPAALENAERDAELDEPSQPAEAPRPHLMPRAEPVPVSTLP